MFVINTARVVFFLYRKYKMKKLSKLALLCLAALTAISVSAQVSPRINALQKELKKGSGTAVAQFWDEVKRRGTPLIESAKDDKQSVLVTFLWRGAAGG